MKRNILILAFIATFFGFYSCQNNQGEDALSDLQEQSITFENFFEQVSNKEIAIPKDKVLLVNYEYDAQKRTMKVLSSEIAEPSWGIALDVAEQLKMAKRVDGKTYTVSCDKGGKDGKGWKKSCSGKFSCGKLAYDCLEIGGCATICKAPLAFVPETDTFYLSDDIEKLVELNP